MPKGTQLTDAQKAAKAAEKAKKFKELAAKRLANVQKAMALLGNLASYKPTETQVKFLQEQVAGSAQNAFARFAGKSPTSDIVIPD